MFYRSGLLLAFPSSAPVPIDNFLDFPTFLKMNDHSKVLAHDILLPPVHKYHETG